MFISVKMYFKHLIEKINISQYFNLNVRGGEGGRRGGSEICFQKKTVMAW